MYQGKFTRIQNEDLGKEPPKSLTPVVYQLNLIIDYLKTAFANAITAQDNMIDNIRPLQIKSTGVPATDTLTFSVSLPNGYQPVGLIVCNCIDLSGAIVGNPVWAEMQPGLVNGDVIVRAIYGLTLDHTYQITFRVF
jgi:hypothetical protein